MNELNELREGTVAVTDDVQLWQLACSACGSRIGVLHIDRGEGRPPFRFCVICGHPAAFYRRYGA